MKFIIATVNILFLLLHFTNGLEDPYKVLGVRRSDSVGKIKKAYKFLALQ